MGQELGETGIAESGEVQGVLVHWAGDNRIDFASERQASGFLHGFPSNPPGLFGEQGAGSGTARCTGGYRSPLPAPEKNEIRVERTER